MAIPHIFGGLSGPIPLQYLDDNFVYVGSTSNSAYSQGTPIAAGAFVVGQLYTIAFVGSTNFLAIGATSNTVGTQFTATGAGSGTGTAYLTRSITGKLQEYVSVLDFGADPTGVQNSSAVFAAVVAAASDILVPAGTYLIGTNLTVPRGTVLRFVNGASLSVATGVTVTIQGQVDAPIVRIFSGLGTVTGIRQVYPEWFGALGNNTGNDQPFLQAAINCVQTSDSSDGQRPTVFLTKYYQVNNTVTITPTTNMPIAIIGNGTSLGACSRINASATFPSAPVVLVAGTVGGTIPDFVLRDFGIVGQAGMSATAGLQIGSVTVGTSFRGQEWSLIENIFVSYFPQGIQIQNCGLLEFRRCSVWNNTYPSANNALLLQSIAGTSGPADLRFIDCQFIEASVASSYCVQINSVGGAYSGGLNQIAGVMFDNCDFYLGQTGVLMYAGNGALLDDIWIRDCQFDNGNIQNIVIQSDSSGGATTLVQDIHIVDNYLNVGTGDQILVQSTGSTGGYIREIDIHDNWIAGGFGRAINLYNTAGSNISGIIIHHNMISNLNNASNAAIEIGSAVSHIVCTGNILSRLPASGAAPKYMVQIESGANYYIVTDNQGIGIAITATINDLGGAVSKVVANNL